MEVEPYLNFDGRCEEALDFYKKAIGATVTMLMRFKESPDKSMITPGSEEKGHASAVQLGDSLVLMSDGRCTGKANFNGIALAISTKTRGRSRQDFQRSGRRRPSEACRWPRRSFSSKFGMLADKFGVGWMVLVAN